MKVETPRSCSWRVTMKRAMRPLQSNRRLAGSLHPSTCILPLMFRICSFALLLLWGAGVAAAGKADFVRDIRPIISENCVFCHGPDEQTREAGLRLDTAEGLAEMVQPGDPEASELLRRITSEDRYERMPPTDSNRALTAKQIQSVRDWIEQGAVWQQHWSLRPLLAPAVPKLAGDRPVDNPIDAFVQAKLEQVGLEISPPAD